MPQQLIFTSAPSGLKPGKSGYCTVAVSGGIREALVLRLEQLSYYSHPAGGGRGRPVFASRVMDLRGTRYHVLSRIQDAGLDFTGRTNYLAHHLVFTPEELPELPSPPVIFRDWNGWRSAWTESPRHLADESWGNLPELSARDQVPATTWREVTGRAANASGLLDLPAPAYLQAGGLNEPQLLGLIAESLQMLEVRSADGLHRVQAWLHTFTTGLQEQDDVRDFRWRCVTPESPAFARLQGSAQRVVALRQIQAADASELERFYAENGPCAPQIQTQPLPQTLTEGETLRLAVEVRAVPPVTVQEWYECDRQGNPVSAPVAPGTVLELPNIALGEKRFRFRAANARGQEVWSDVAKVSAEPKVRLVTSRRPADPGSTPLTLQSSSKGHLPAGGTHSSQRAARENDLASRNERSVLGWAVLLVLLLGLGAVGAWWKWWYDPLKLEAQLGVGQVVLTWKPRWEGEVVSYDVKRSDNKTGPFTNVSASNIQSIRFPIHDFKDGKTYFYQVIANKFRGGDNAGPGDKPLETSPSRVVRVDPPVSSGEPSSPSQGPATQATSANNGQPQETSGSSNAAVVPTTVPVQAEARAKLVLTPTPAAAGATSVTKKGPYQFTGIFTNGVLKLPADEIATWIQSQQPPYLHDNLTISILYADPEPRKVIFEIRSYTNSPRIDLPVLRIMDERHALERKYREKTEPAFKAWEEAWEELIKPRPVIKQSVLDRVFKELNEPTAPEQICDAFWKVFSTLCEYAVNDGKTYSFPRTKEERVKAVILVRSDFQKGLEKQIGSKTPFGRVISDEHFTTLNELFDLKNLENMLQGKRMNYDTLRKRVRKLAVAQSPAVERQLIALKLQYQKTNTIAEVTFK